MLAIKTRKSWCTMQACSIQTTQTQHLLLGLYARRLPLWQIQDDTFCHDRLAYSSSFSQNTPLDSVVSKPKPPK